MWQKKNSLGFYICFKTTQEQDNIHGCIMPPPPREGFWMDGHQKESYFILYHTSPPKIIYFSLKT